MPLAPNLNVVGKVTLTDGTVHDNVRVRLDHRRAVARLESPGDRSAVSHSVEGTPVVSVKPDPSVRLRLLVTFADGTLWTIDRTAPRSGCGCGR